jgi:hypothetical protein
MCSKRPRVLYVARTTYDLSRVESSVCTFHVISSRNRKKPSLTPKKPLLTPKKPSAKICSDGFFVPRPHLPAPTASDASSHQCRSLNPRIHTVEHVSRKKFGCRNDHKLFHVFFDYLEIVGIRRHDKVLTFDGEARDQGVHSQGF